MQKELKIGDRIIGAAHRPLVIAEIAQAHDGSLGMAHAFIDAVAAAGADAIKFQTHLAAAESTMREPWRVKFSKQDATRFDYWRRMEFEEHEWEGLESHALAQGLIFLSSPFSPEAVNLLLRLGVPAWKVASGEITTLPLIDKMASSGLPVILSSGMSSYAELDAAVGVCRRHGVPFAVMQCTTEYPCVAEHVGLNVLGQMAGRYGCPVGLSDHSAEIYGMLAAVSLGAALVETHITLSREMFGPDVPASLTPDQLSDLVHGVDFVWRALQSPVDKDARAAESRALRGTFGKSIVARSDLPAGTVLAESDLALKKPGTGLPASAWDQVLGQRLNQAVAADEEIREEALD